MPGAEDTVHYVYPEPIRPTQANWFPEDRGRFKVSKTRAFSPAIGRCTQTASIVYLKRSIAGIDGNRVAA